MKETKETKTIDEAAEVYAKKTWPDPAEKMDRYRDYSNNGFITGAKSDAARDYWASQFQPPQPEQYSFCEGCGWPTEDCNCLPD